MEQLAQYLELPDEELCRQAKTMRRQVDRSLWNLGLYLVAIQQRKLHRARGCSGVIQFAVRYLDLAQQKAYELLRATTSLLDTPLLAEAFRDGKVCWGKIREITRVSTSADEAFWLDYALHHDCDEVQRRVSVSPRRFKALRRQSDSHGLPTERQPAQGGLLASDLEANGAAGVHSEAPQPAYQSLAQQQFQPQHHARNQPPGSAEPPVGRVKLVFYLTAEEFALYERAEDRVRSQRGRRLPRNKVLIDLAEHRLSDARSEARARLPILVRVDASTGQGWYDTRLGLLPATAAQIEQALTSALAVTTEGMPPDPDLGAMSGQAQGDNGPIPGTAPPTCHLTDSALPQVPDKPDEGPGQASRKKRSSRRRRNISLATIRALMLRAGGKCEKPGCNRGGALHVHHQRPVSEGGQDGLADLRLYCSSCHGLEHEPDFERKPGWHEAREHRRGGKTDRCDSS
jgi:5-methylcytosine-specific restriction endonuclease McrA